MQEHSFAAREYRCKVSRGTVIKHERMTKQDGGEQLREKEKRKLVADLVGRQNCHTPTWLQQQGAIRAVGEVGEG